jgi:hypothetical protein
MVRLRCGERGQDGWQQGWLGVHGGQQAAALDAMPEARQAGKVASGVVTGLEASGSVAARDEVGWGTETGRWSSSAGEQRGGAELWE